jgi:hypothetical protein
MVLLAAFAFASIMTIRREEKKPVSDSTSCLTDRACGPGWRCYAEPKADPFAVMGLCSHVCDRDADCGAALHCLEVAATRDQVVPLTAAGAAAQRVRVCRPP